MEKKFLSYFLFFFVLFIIVLPPLVGQFFLERQSEVVAQYPLSVFLTGALALLIYLFAMKGVVFNEPFEKVQRPFFESFYNYSSNSLVCFGFLCLCTALLEIIAYFSGIDSGIKNIVFPDSLFGKLNFLCGVIAAAFSEEVIYRFYLPRSFKEMLSKKFGDNPRLSLFCEGLALLLFSMGHLYLGILGFINALLCGAALRLCMIRTKSLWIPFIIHTLYNLLSFLIAWKVF